MVARLLVVYNLAFMKTFSNHSGKVVEFIPEPLGFAENLNAIAASCGTLILLVETAMAGRMRKSDGDYPGTIKGFSRDSSKINAIPRRRGTLLFLGLPRDLFIRRNFNWGKPPPRGQG